MGTGEQVAEASSQAEQTQLGLFFDYIYGEETGYVYVARKTPGNQHDFKQEFFSWPERRSDLVNFVLSWRAQYEVYTAPALFTTGENAMKSDIKGASVYWVEFDGELPKDLLGLPEPTLRIQSSNEGHEHWYWKLDELITNVSDIESVNRALTYLFAADSSGWDASQILRPPFTFNHKRQRETKILEVKENIYLPPALFTGLPQPPPPVEAPIPDKIPPIEQVIMKYPFPEAANSLFRSGPQEHKRSDQLMSLGYYCAEMNMTVEEILSVLMNADERWQKFAGRQDRMTRLMEIVTIARAKFPPKSEGVDGRPLLQPMGFKTLLAAQVNLEWVWEGLLQEAGYMLVTGPSGIGKTQFSLCGAGNMALGKDFLDRKVGKPRRIGFFSLEMGLVDLKYFLMQLGEGWTAEEKEVLEENLQFFPLGEPLYMTKPEVRADIEQLVGDLKLDGIVVDSLGSATDEEVSDEKFKRFFHWNDTLRQRQGVFTWYIHHHRKASGDNKKPNKLNDVYGSQYITSYATSVLCLWDGSVVDSTQCIPLKVRLAKRPLPFNMHKDNNLHFTRLTPNIGPQSGEIILDMGDSDSSGAESVPDSAATTGAWSAHGDDTGQPAAPGGTSGKTPHGGFDI